MAELAQYGGALAGLMVLVLMQMAFSPLTGLAKGKAGIAPGAEPAADYASPTYRMHRLYANSAENLAPIAVAVFAAMAAGVSATFVGLMVWLHVAARIAYAVVLFQGIGKPHSGLRSICYVLGWLAVVVLAATVLMKVIF